jgi:predicted amidohydrolase YtcJ
MYRTRLGADRARTLNPFAAMSRAGVPLALGSDAPVTPLGGWEAVRAATYHHTPEHALTAGDAFAAHTVGGWRAAKVDAAGVIAVGAPAHLAVWATEGRLPGLPDLAPGATIPTCLRTVVAGRTVFTLEGALA